MDDLFASRYARHEAFQPVGSKGQSRLRSASVLLVGCGALGTHLAEVLVRAGVGRLTIIDRDLVEASNLQRQGLFTEDDVVNAAPKAEAARRRLKRINRDVKLTTIVGDFSPENAEDLVEDHDLCLDASDNFETRLLLNDACVRLDKPWVYAGCVGSRAVCMPVIPCRSACLACLLEEAPAFGGETCDTTGILMPAVLMAVAMSSSEALKILTGNEAALVHRLRSVDVWSGSTRSINAETRNPDCRACGRREFSYLSGREASKTVKLCGRNSVQVFPSQVSELNLATLEASLTGAFVVLARNAFALVVREGDLELTVFRDGRCLVSGTTDSARAKALVAKILGG